MCSILKFKSNVQVPKVCIIAVAFINSVNTLGLKIDMWVTSGIDGLHILGSKHYSYEALDFRSKHLSSIDKRRVMKEVKRRLGKNYDVILEDESKNNEHFHIEFDKK